MKSNVIMICKGSGGYIVTICTAKLSTKASPNIKEKKWLEKLLHGSTKNN